MPHCQRKRRPIATGTRVPLSQMWHYYQGTIVMLKTKKSAPGVTRSLSATALIAATILAGGLSEASAKSKKHHYRAGSSHSWKDANAAIPSSGTGTFAGVASFYGNESGSKTASGQRFNENDMT